MTIMKCREGNLCYLQSGGPTEVINSSFLGLYQTYKEKLPKSKFYVSRFGIAGLLSGELEDISKKKLPSLLVRPGAYFGSLRKRLTDDVDSAEAKSIIATLKKYQIKFLFLNGGNDSMDSAYKIGLYLKASDYQCQIAGIPKTIDNDLANTDHTPGFASAAKFIANAVIGINIDDHSYDKGRINIVEAMGRDCGYLAASSYLANKKKFGPDYIYVPEVAFDVKDAINKAEATYKKTGHCLMVVSEGIRDKDGVFIASIQQKDSFGHTQMGGVGLYLANLINQDGIKTRAIELSLMQRSGSFVSCKRDIDEAKGVGRNALLKMLKGKDQFMVSIKRVSNKPYKIIYDDCPLKGVAEIAISLPKKFISKSKDNITPSFMDYALPLIQGEEPDTFTDGLLNV